MEYPKPNPNYRVCGHGTANQFAPWGFDERGWLKEVKTLGWSHVKGLSDRDGNTGVKWSQIALDLGLMPVVRIYATMPYMLDDTIKKAIDRLVAAGVHYMETINEPELPVEWGGNRPDNWADITAGNMIALARYIQAAGGIPIICALATGSPDSKMDMTALMIKHGGGDIFKKRFVMGVHNYTINHPLGLAEWDQTNTYPLDDVNQKGTPISEEMYRKYGEQNSLAWEGRSREWVNQRRQARKNPGATIFTDNCGEVNLFYVAEKAKQTLGFYPMCIVTEGGVIIGDAQDDRYPKNTGAYMRDANVEIARRCMGTSTAHTYYPDWVLAGGGYWLLGNYRMGHNAHNWESQAWYTDTWPQYNSGGRLWVVDAMKAMPKVAYGTPYEPPPPPVDPQKPDVDWQIPLTQVKLIPAGVKPGDTYWKLVKARWENEQQAQGKHHIFVEVLNETGQRLAGIPVALSNGGTVTGRTEANKPLDFAMYGTLGSYTVYVAQDAVRAAPDIVYVALDISDWVMGMGLGTPEQPHYAIHTCFYLTFQRTTKVLVPSGPDPSGFHCLLLGQTKKAIEWESVVALKNYVESYRSTITFSHDDAQRYPNVSVVSTMGMPISEEVIGIVRNKVKWLEVIKVSTLAELKAVMDARATSGRKYGGSA